MQGGRVIDKEKSRTPLAAATCNPKRSSVDCRRSIIATRSLDDQDAVALLGQARTAAGVGDDGVADRQDVVSPHVDIELAGRGSADVQLAGERAGVGAVQVETDGLVAGAVLGLHVLGKIQPVNAELQKLRVACHKPQPDQAGPQGIIVLEFKRATRDASAAEVGVGGGED